MRSAVLRQRYDKVVMYNKTVCFFIYTVSDWDIQMLHDSRVMKGCVHVHKYSDLKIVIQIPLQQPNIQIFRPSPSFLGIIDIVSQSKVIFNQCLWAQFYTLDQLGDDMQALISGWAVIFCSASHWHAPIARCNKTPPILKSSYWKSYAVWVLTLQMQKHWCLGLLSMQYCCYRTEIMLCFLSSQIPMADCSSLCCQLLLPTWHPNRWMMLKLW